MVVEKYLKTLASTRHRIIIPNLGAFLLRDGDGELKNLIFSSFLKYNDGNLEKYIAEQEGISQEKSAELVKNFSEEVFNVLNQKKHFVIPDFGYFHLDDRGGVAFVLQESVSEEKVNVSKEEEPQAVVKPAVEEPAVAPVVTPAVEPVQKEEQPQPVPVQPKPVVAPVTKKEPIKPAEPKAQASSNNSLLIIIVVLLLLIVALFASYFIFDGIKEKVNSVLGIESTAKGKDDVDQVVTPPITVDSTEVKPVDTVVHQKKTTADRSGEIPVTKTAKDTYYVIAGTFQEYSNARKLYYETMDAGYDVEMLPKMGPLYPVSVYKTASHSEATAKMREVKAKYGDAWVFKAKR